MGMTLSMEEKVQTAAEAVIHCLPCPRRIVSKGL